ncbi:bacitracin ABC transporter ATP-binding protein [Clostridium acetobutylicum]|nr:bacitracin ABC transporter ATP-binding protein [Clostridium acetobutylicum]
MKHLVRTFNLTKKYKNTSVVENLNLNIEQGQIYGFLGKNGAGKTTTLRMILGLIKISTGEVELFGEKNPTRSIYKKIGSIIEYPGFYPNLTAEENLDIHRRMMKIENEKCINETLTMVGLDSNSIKGKKVKNFSLGMKQRLGLARALLHEPELLILDEPTNGLDPLGIKSMRETLIALCKDRGITILVSSHLLSEIEQLTTKIGIIDKGHLIEELTYDDLQKRNKKYLKLKVSDVKEACSLIKNNLNIKDYEIIGKDAIKVYEKINESSTIAKTLIKNDIELYEMSFSKDNLEDYFVKVTEGDSNV